MGQRAAERATASGTREGGSPTKLEQRVHYDVNEAPAGGDADTLQGEDGAFYLNRANHTGTDPASIVTFVPAGNVSATDVQAAIEELDAEKLAASAYTAGDVLSKLLTVDGSGSGLDADTLDGNDVAYFLPAASYTAADVLAKIETVDGAGSGLDADKLDGLEGADFVKLAGSQTVSGPKTFSAQAIFGDPATLAITSNINGSSELNNGPMFVAHNTSGADAIVADSASAFPPGLAFRVCGGTLAAPSNVTPGMQLGFVDFRGFNGTEYINSASIDFIVSTGTAYSAGDVLPTKLRLCTGNPTDGVKVNAWLDEHGALICSQFSTVPAIGGPGTRLAVDVRVAEWGAVVIAQPASGAGFGLRAHTLGTTSSDIPFAVSSGAGTGAMVFEVFGNGAASLSGSLSFGDPATTRTNLGVGTGDSPQFAAVNIGHASDTTVARASAGDISVEGNIVYRAGGTDVAVADGGTGASSASVARTNLGLALGSDVQAYDPLLASIAGLTFGADSFIYGTGTDVAAVGTITTFGRSLVDDANAAAARTTLGLVIGTDVQAQDAELQAFAGLTSAADRLPYFTGLGTAALATFTAFGRSLVDDADAAAARTTLGLVIGTDVQAFDPDLSTWAGVTPGTGVTTALAVNVGSLGAFVVLGGAGGTPSSLTLTNATGLPASGLVASTSAAVGFGSIELGHASDTTLARASAGDVNIEGNIIYRAGGTDVAVADGGTGSSTASGARTNLGLGTIATQAASAVAITGGTLSGITSFAAALGSNDFSITTTGQHLRMNNGSELGVVSLASGGQVDIWAHGDNSTDIIRLLTGSGSGTIQANVDASGLNLPTGKVLRVNSVQVVGGRKTGWSVDTGTAKRTANATYSATAEATYTQATIQTLMDTVRDLSQTIKALKDDLHGTAGHGLIGT